MLFIGGVITIVGSLAMMGGRYTKSKPLEASLDLIGVLAITTGCVLMTIAVAQMPVMQ